MITRLFARAFSALSVLAVAGFVLAACNPNDVASFDRVIVNIESAIQLNFSSRPRDRTALRVVRVPPRGVELTR
jgi:hypothetical protein